jgi:hypothetical protein
MKRSGFARGICAALAIAAFAAPGAASARMVPAAAYQATVDYVRHFYPLWFSHFQSQFASHNRLVGPDRISPLYQIVVAINDDTLYASTFLDLADEPVVLTIPSTTTCYSILTLDPYGDIFTSGLVAGTPGTYMLTGPHWTGTVPNNVTRIAMPLDHSIIIFRADKFSNGQDMTAAATTFRASLLMQTLSAWQANPSGGAPSILPEATFAAPFKVAADRLSQWQPNTFLTQLQTAVHSSDTPPLSARERALSDRFDQYFAIAPGDAIFAVATQQAHRDITASYLEHTGPTNWINFLDIGQWAPQNDVERSAITEYIQYGNNHATAAYYQAFRDKTGFALDGSDPRGYTITIPKDALPQASRFWSFTAYTPKSIELIGNAANKYEIASYTPGLTYNQDGSLTLYIVQTQPAGIPTANWLPVAAEPFNIMLRVYGPEGAVAAGTYVPPAIMRK